MRSQHQPAGAESPGLQASNCRKDWRRGPGSNRRIKVLQFTEPRLSRYESRALPLGEVPKNRLFSTHFLLIGSLTAARILSSSSALLVSAGWYMLPLSVIIPGQSSGPDDSRILNPFRFPVKFRLQTPDRWKPGLFRAAFQFGKRFRISLSCWFY